MNIDKKKNKFIKIRVSTEHKNSVQTYCKANKITVSKLIRDTLKTITHDPAT